MTAAAYTEFVDTEYTKFRRSLLRHKGGPRQREFLRAARNNEKFLSFVEDSMATTGSRESPLCSECLTEHEFKQPPASTEAALYEAWNELSPRIACRTTFWARVTCRHIAKGRIQAVYLAANGGPTITAAERIDHALLSSGDGATKRIDDCVRTVLRRLSGLPEARGNRSVYVDCPFARAWWRERLVAEMAHGDPEGASSVRAAIRTTQTYWEELVTLVVSRNSVLGSHGVRNAFLLSLADLLHREPSTPMRTGKNLRMACRSLGVIQASRELSVLEPSELRALMDDIVTVQHEQAIKRSAADENLATPEPAV